jgi:hypothetical protein
LVKSTGYKGIPLGAQIDPNDFKALCLDVGLSQAILGLTLGEWLVNKEKAFTRIRLMGYVFRHKIIHCMKKYNHTRFMQLRHFLCMMWSGGRRLKVYFQNKSLYGN